MILSKNRINLILLLGILFGVTFFTAKSGTITPENFLVVDAIPDPSVTSAGEIEDFLIAYGNPESVDYNPEWKIVLNDQYVFLLVIHTDHISLSLLKYDMLFSDNSVPKAQGIVSIASARRNGNFASRFVDDSFDYQSLIEELFNDIKSYTDEIGNKNSTLIILAPPEVCFENSETIDIKVRLLKHARIPIDSVKLCESCTTKVSYEEYAVYHNLGDVLFYETYDLKKGVVDIERTVESRALRMFLGWNRDGFYAAGPLFLLQEEYNASGQVVDIKKSSGRTEEFVYFTPFYSIPQIIEDIRRASGKDDKCFNRGTDVNRIESAKACKQLVSSYFTSTSKFYQQRKEFNRPINYTRSPIVKVKKEDIAKGLKVIIENRELLSFVSFQEEVDKDTEEYPASLKEIKELVKAACEGDYEKSEETKAFDSTEFCLTLEILTSQISSIFAGQNLDLHIKTRHSNDQPTDAGWLLGAVSSKILTSNFQEESNLYLIKEQAFGKTAENHRQYVIKVTSFLLAIVIGVIIFGYVVKYKRYEESSELNAKSK